MDTSESTGQREGFLRSLERHSTEVISPASKVYVYEGPLRLWHWVNALCLITLGVTGYLIGVPLPSVGGEASENFEFTTHVLPPRGVMHYCKSLYGASPRAEILMIQGHDWGLRNGMSDRALENLETALAFFRETVLNPLV